VNVSWIARVITGFFLAACVHLWMVCVDVFGVIRYPAIILDNSLISRGESAMVVYINTFSVLFGAYGGVAKSPNLYFVYLSGILIYKRWSTSKARRLDMDRAEMLAASPKNMWGESIPVPVCTSQKI
jgi:hypothetical protein